MQDLLNSNAIQTILVSASGAAAYFAHKYWPQMLPVVCGIASTLIVLSFLLDIGEVYSYSDYYKRAYWYFGDDVTTCLTPLLIWSLLSRRNILSLSIAASIIMSGGRMAIIILIIQILLLFLLPRINCRKVLNGLSVAIPVALGLYFIFVSISPSAIGFSNKLTVALVGKPLFEISTDGGDCRGENCFENKVNRPARIRLYGAIAGMWMTVQGGYPGADFPNTPEKLAHLMMDANPWGVNDKLGLTEKDWIETGTIQSPYLQFGAGYGPYLLLLVMTFIGGVGFVGFRSLLTAPPDPNSALSIFFIINAVFNQTQAWLLPGPVLFLMAFCGTHVLLQLRPFKGRTAETPAVAASFNG